MGEEGVEGEESGRVDAGLLGLWCRVECRVSGELR